MHFDCFCVFQRKIDYNKAPENDLGCTIIPSKTIRIVFGFVLPMELVLER
jgi:hypothetical protein